MTNILRGKTLNQMVEKDGLDKYSIKLTESQMEMLRLSEEDIKAGRLISHEELEKETLAWLKEK